MTPLFPFGFGLSYTTFSITNVNVVTSLTSTNQHQFFVDVVVGNTGTVAGAEVVQVYLGLPDATGEPPKRLVGWWKAFLNPGQRVVVRVAVDENDSSHPMSYWDTNSDSWQTAPGDYLVYVGNSSANLTQAGTVHVGS
jgi:beta-glucosidase